MSRVNGKKSHNKKWSMERDEFFDPLQSGVYMSFMLGLLHKQ